MQLCTFHLADLFLGVDVLGVQEVLRSRELTAVPLTTAAIKGLLNIRGQIVTAIDLRCRMALPAAPPDQCPFNLVVRTEEGPVSLLVDSMGDVLEVAEQDFEPLPGSIRSQHRDLLRGVYKLQDRLLLVLDIEKAVVVPAS